MAKKRGNGDGTIRPRADGRYEARYTVGFDPGTGKQIRKSVYGKTRQEAAKKLRAATNAIDTGTYMEPSKMTVGQWLDVWITEYSGGLKPNTVEQYKMHIRLNLKPSMGAVLLSVLSAHMIQSTYNALQRREKPLSPKSIRNLNGVLHSALEKAVKLGYIRYNPCKAVSLPRVERHEMHVIGDDALPLFMDEIKEHRYEAVYLVDMFTGLRQGEILGLQWSCVDFERGTIFIDKQLQRERKKGGQYHLAPLKNDRPRTITPARYVLDLLKEQKRTQAGWQLRAGEAWANPMNLVFTNELGGNLCKVSVYNAFKRVVKGLGLDAVRFHDLRHTFATLSLQNGDDIKTVQGALGHHTAAFTLDQYGHVTHAMQRASADRMDALIQGIKQG